MEFTINEEARNPNQIVQNQIKLDLSELKLIKVTLKLGLEI